MRDSRNKEKESGNWRPGKWTHEHIAATIRHAHLRSLIELELFVGPHHGRVIGAQLVAAYKERISVDKLRDLGVQTIGQQAAQ